MKNSRTRLPWGPVGTDPLLASHQPFGYGTPSFGKGRFLTNRAVLLSLLFVPAWAGANEDPPPGDPLHREQDPVVFEGSSWPEGFTAAERIEGNAATPIRPPEARVAEAPLPAGAAPERAAMAASVGGFAQLEMIGAFYDGGSYDLTFRPRELELDADILYRDIARLRLDLNLIVDDIASTFSTIGFDRLLLTDLIEQVYVNYRACCFDARLGIMNAPLGVEALDPLGRVTLSRSPLALLALPTSTTGVLVAAPTPLPELGVVAMAFNGWASGIDANDQKSFLLGLPHHLGNYHGAITGIIGAERTDSPDLRWLVNYDAALEPTSWLNLLLEVAYGQEGGLGRRKKTGLPDGTKAATWYGGHLEAQTAGDAVPVQAALRLVYLHDPDLVMGLPSYPNLGSLTTLFSTTLAARYPLLHNLEAVAEYRTDFERGDVANVSIQRNYDVFPEFWNLGRWFVTHTASVGVLARY